MGITREARGGIQAGAGARNSLASSIVKSKMGSATSWQVRCRAQSDHCFEAGDGFGRGSRKAMLIPIRTGEPSVMSFIKRAKILATRVYEFFEGGDIDTIANSPDNLIRRTNRTTFSDLRKSGIHQAFGEFVVHTPSVAITSSCCSGARRVAKPDLGKPSKTIKPSDRRLPQR